MIGHTDATIQLWDLRSLRPATERISAVVDAELGGGRAGFVFLVASGVSADGRALLASMLGTGELITWDATTLPLTRLSETASGGSSERVGALEFTPDGQLAIGRVVDGSIDLVDPLTLEQSGPTLRRTGNPTPTYEVAFSSDGSLAVAGHFAPGTDTVLFDTRTGDQIGVSFGEGLRHRAITPGGRFLVIGSDDGIVIWELDFDRWEEAACRAAGGNLTQEEWEEFFPGRDYEVTCPGWPDGRDAA